MPGPGPRRAALWGACCLLGLLAAPSAVHAGGKFEQVDAEIVIEAVSGQLRYDTTSFAVEPGARVKLTLKNPDAMQHNLVLVRGSDEQATALAKRGWQRGPDAGYVPDSERILTRTRIVEPQSSQTIYFRAPKEEGAYPYVCTLPGHVFTMRGTMRVASGALSEGKAGLKNVRYRVYKGKWKKLPDFGKLEPVRSAIVDNGRFDIGVAKQKERFGLVFEGDLSVPVEGEYQFTIDSDDGSRLLIGGEPVAARDGVHALGRPKAATAHLKAGTHPIRVEYFEHHGQQGLRLSWRGPTFGERSLTPNAPGSVESDRAYHVLVTDEPKVERLFMPNASPRAIAVGLVGGFSYCFDVPSLSVRYGWYGPFLDAGPDLKGRGGKKARPLGERFGVGAADRPLRIGEPDARPKNVAFRGYRKLPHPVMRYTVDGIDVTQKVEGVEGPRGLRYTFTLSPTPSEPVFFKFGRKGLTVSSDKGEWDGDTLKVPAERAKRFTVTVRAANSG